jgi:hypothetical protein
MCFVCVPAELNEDWAAAAPCRNGPVVADPLRAPTPAYVLAKTRLAYGALSPSRLSGIILCERSLFVNDQLPQAQAGDPPLFSKWAGL